MNSELRTHNLSVAAKSAIKKGSKSFSLASLFFDRNTQQAVFDLYIWCRHVDDQIDQQTSFEDKYKILQKLRAETLSAFAGDPTDSVVYQCFSRTVLQYKIPRYYAEELLEGMKMDIENFQYRTVQDLDLYCYRVAGVVGLMMCHIMGLRDQTSLGEACKMGMAMQLTNITRDVIEDAEMGRCYLPEVWLRTEKLEDRDFLASPNRTLSILAQMVQRAEAFYQEAERGTLNLPWRAALAIQAAREIYSSIGPEVLRAADLKKRAVVPLWKKVLKLGIAVVKILYQVPTRIRKPFRPTQITSVWRLTS